MYHRLRSLHRWIGLLAALFLLVIAVTGFLLATKGRFGWIRPPEAEGGSLETLAQVVSVEQAVEAAFAVGLSELSTLADIDRVDYRPRSNVFKILSRKGYKEVQVDGSSGRVLSVANRTDQLAEDIHDLSFFGKWFHENWLPVVAVLLFGLSLTGIYVFFNPVLRRWKFKRNQKH